METTSVCAATGQQQGQTRAGGSRAAGRAAGPRASVTGHCSGGRRGRKREGDTGHSPARRSCSNPWRPRVSAPGVPAKHSRSATPPHWAAVRCGAGRTEGGTEGAPEKWRGPRGPVRRARPHQKRRRGAPSSSSPRSGRSGKGRDARGGACKGRGLGRAWPAPCGAGVPARTAAPPPPRPPRPAAASGVIMASGLWSLGCWPS